MTKEEFKNISNKIDLPDSPGVYFFRDGDKSKDVEGNIIYIGKATSLKDRVKSYFSNDLMDARGPKIVNMILVAENITFQKTESVLEALLLENILIKKHGPTFNTKEKDDKSYMCVVITKENYPRVLIMRIRDYEKRFLINKIEVDKVYGPFVSASQIKDALKIIRKIFPFRDRCELGQSKPCFNAQIKLCPGCCAGLINKADYTNNIKHIKDFFSGKVSKIKKDLEKEMNECAKGENFERAAQIRNTMLAMDHIRDVSLIKNTDDYENVKISKDKKYRIEAYDVAHISGTNRVGVMTVVVDGKKISSEYKKFKLLENINDDYAGIYEMLNRRLVHTEWDLPDLIIIDGGIGQKNMAEKVLTKFINKNKIYDKIRILSVVKDDKHKAREILGIENIIGEKVDINKKEKKIENEKLKQSIILANAEAHRFAINYHKKLREEKNFIF